jgi:predicted RNA-binding Zn ribbon-like protein
VSFDYVGGDIATDLVNTADWTDHGLGNDELRDYTQLVEWAEGAGAITADAARALRAAADAHPIEAAAALDAARRLRGVVHSVFSAVIARRSPDLTALNIALASALAHRRLGDGGRWVWQGAERNLESPLWPAALAAATLLTSADAAKLRVCAKPDCGWMFVDRSRNGLRRWCQMATCGTAEKSRRRAAKTKP